MKGKKKDDLWPEQSQQIRNRRLLQYNILRARACVRKSNIKRIKSPCVKISLPKRYLPIRQIVSEKKTKININILYFNQMSRSIYNIFEK